MKNANVVIALVMGVVIGLVVGRMTSKDGNSMGGNVMAKALPGAGGAPSAAAADADPTYKIPVGDAHVKGPADALVTIVEFSDFQCPFCSKVGPTLKQIEETYGAKVRVAFKHNPLPFHPNAVPAAMAAEAAGAQGKFWEMHDLLFANQKALTRPDLESYAAQLHLDMERFKRDLDTNAFKSKIDAQQAQARQLGASGTPGFFINGKFLRGAQPYPAFKAIIDRELAAAEKLTGSGVSKAQVYDRIISRGITSAPKPAAQPQNAQRPQQPARPQFAKVQVGDAHTKGPADAKVTIVEWSDFQCPYCSRVVPTVKQIEETYGKDVRIAFKHQPLPFHNNAQIAAEAAEAAGAQGKFWQMHDKLFENQKALSRQDLEGYAAAIGLNMSKFKADLEQGSFKKKITAHQNEGRSAGANGTPTFFINGRLLSGAQPFPSFKTVIDQELQKADALLKAGTPRAQLYAKQLAANEKAYGGSAPAAPAQPTGPVDVKIGAAPVKGPANAPVTIVIFSDFQCPFCSKVEPTLKQIEETYGSKVRFAWKNQPLPFHQFAMGAAEAALAANEQGKFWEMHDKIFENQSALTATDLERYASEVGLDMAKYKAAASSGKFKAQIQADQAEGAKIGANGTPTFFINGQKLVGAQPFPAFKSLIDAELAKK